MSSDSVGSKLNNKGDQIAIIITRSDKTLCGLIKIRQ